MGPRALQGLRLGKYPPKLPYECRCECFCICSTTTVSMGKNYVKAVLKEWQSAALGHSIVKDFQFGAAGVCDHMENYRVLLAQGFTV